jgi:hypothetical protein
LKILNGHRPSVPQELLSKEYTEEIASRIKNYFFKTNELSNSVTNSNIDFVCIVKMYFELCTSCWSNNPSERPMFEEIIIKLQDIENLLHNKINDFDDK